MKKYIRTWKMEPIPAAVIASLTPSDVEKRFYDDRLEPIPYDEPTDLVAISVETYTARRSYQIASEYRKRGVPVVMGGFHATLCPDEVQRYCESIVIGEAEDVFPELIDDYRAGRPQRVYRADRRPNLNQLEPDRSIFIGKRYLPIRLVEFGRGCKFACDFCAIQSAFGATQTHRPVEQVVAEVRRVQRPGQMIFFIDDNFTSDLEAAKSLMRALIPLGIRWVSQSSINVAYDDEALQLMRASGCQCMLVGFESLNRDTLQTMHKDFNMMQGGPPEAIANFQRHGLGLYGTFIFGYDSDTADTFAETLEFAKKQGLFIAAFAHITPFPGTPLYERLRAEGRLVFDPWWLDERYRYNMISFKPKNMSPEELAVRCDEARQNFYEWKSIFRRLGKRVNHRDPWTAANFLWINAMHRFDVVGRNGLPLGDEAWQGPLIPA
jgi:radical SAM superfamily enzyme YgiQ (UPF0313 family)